MDLFDSAIFDSAIFDTGDGVELHGAVTKPRKKIRGPGRNYDLDLIEAEERAKKAAEPAPVVEAPKPKKRPAPDAGAILADKLAAALAGRNAGSIARKAQEAAQAQALREAQEQEIARQAAEQALADAIALQRALDDEAAQAFLAWLMES